MSNLPNWGVIAGHIMEHAPDPEEAAKSLIAAGYHLGHEHNEFGIFRKKGLAELTKPTPVENMIFTTRELAERWIKKGLINPESWEVRGRYVTEWK